MIVHKCDKCGLEMEKPSVKVEIDFSSTGVVSKPVLWELCEWCYKDLLRWKATTK